MAKIAISSNHCYNDNGYSHLFAIRFTYKNLSITWQKSNSYHFYNENGYCYYLSVQAYAKSKRELLCMCHICLWKVICLRDRMARLLIDIQNLQCVFLSLLIMCKFFLLIYNNSSKNTVSSITRNISIIFTGLGAEHKCL